MTIQQGREDIKLGKYYCHDLQDFGISRVYTTPMEAYISALETVAEAARVADSIVSTPPEPTMGRYTHQQLVDHVANSLMQVQNILCQALAALDDSGEHTSGSSG